MAGSAGLVPASLHYVNPGDLILSIVDVNGAVNAGYIPYLNSQTTMTAFGSDTNPPVVTMPSANPSVIPNDGTTTSFLSVYATDDTAIDEVTIDLSPIGGPSSLTLYLLAYDENGSLFGCNVSASCSPGIYDLYLNATDILGNCNNSLSIELEIIVPLCGDVTCDGGVDVADVGRLLYHVGFPGDPRYPICSDWAADVTSDGAIDVSDVGLLLYHVGFPGDARYTLRCGT